MVVIVLLVSVSKHSYNTNRAMSLREVQAFYGLSYSRVRRMIRLPGFPLIEGVVFQGDFDEWRREYYRNPRTGEALQLDAGRRVGELARSSGSQAFVHLALALPLFSCGLLG
jgi:hypothetical protein